MLESFSFFGVQKEMTLMAKEEKQRKNKRALYVELGKQAVKALAKFLESKNGELVVSIHESQYSAGSFGQPDLVFKEYGIEVKRIQFVCKHKPYGRQKKPHINLGSFKLEHRSWTDLKAWCAQHGKTPLLVVALHYQRRKPIFVKLTQSQVDELQKSQLYKKYIQLDCWRCLQQGEVWT